MHKYISISKYLYFTFASVPLLLVTGPLIPEIIIFINTVIGFFFFKKDLVHTFKENKIIKFLFFFYIYIVLNSFYNFYDLKLLLKNILYLRFILYFWLILYLLNKYKNFLKYNLFFLIFTYLFIFIDTTYQFIFLEDLFGYKINEWRFSGPFGDEQILGGFIVKFLSLLLITIYISDKYEKNIFVTILTIISFYLVLLSGERSSLFYLSLIFIIIFLFCLNKIIYRLIFITLFLVITLFIFNSYQGVYNRVVNNSINQIFSAKKIYIFSEGHQKIYATALEIAKKNIYFGSGPNSFRNKCKNFEIKNPNKYTCSTHPHNTFLQFTSELGIFLLITLIYFYFRLLILFVKMLYNYNKLKNEKYIIRALSILPLLILLFPLGTSGNFFNNFNNIILFYIAAFSYHFNKSLNKIF